jgi:hypothetical protein
MDSQCSEYEGDYVVTLNRDGCHDPLSHGEVLPERRALELNSLVSH